jgi:hypothetical protein
MTMPEIQSMTPARLIKVIRKHKVVLLDVDGVLLNAVGQVETHTDARGFPTVTVTLEAARIVVEDDMAIYEKGGDDG